MADARFSRRIGKGKRSTKKIKPRLYLILAIILIGILLSPLLWHLSRITRAQDEYDFDLTAAEIAWVNRHAPFLNRWASFRDAKLWLRLNTGPREGLKQELELYQDDRHRLWLFQLLLQDSNTDEAQALIARFSSTPIQTLAQGLMYLAQGDPLKARGLLERLTGLSENEETLRHLALIQINLSLQELEQAQVELKAVLTADPQNPTAKIMEFNLALARRDWTKAVELSAELDQDIRPTPVYLVQKGLLQIYKGSLEQEILTQLGSFPQGKSYVNYLVGINELNQGNLTEGKAMLELALAQGLPGQLHADAENALKQTNDRLRAESSLQAVVNGSGL